MALFEGTLPKLVPESSAPRLVADRVRLVDVPDPEIPLPRSRIADVLGCIACLEVQAPMATLRTTIVDASTLTVVTPSM